MQLFINRQFLAEATADAQGRWTISPAQAIAPGVYTLAVVQLDENGRPKYAIELPFERARPSDIDLRDGKVIGATLLGDSSKVVIGIREDVQVKLLDQATVGGINLAERDMVALRFKFRVAFATAYSTARIGGQPTDYPFAVITPTDPVDALGYFIVQRFPIAGSYTLANVSDQ